MGVEGVDAVCRGVWYGCGDGGGGGLGRWRRREEVRLGVWCGRGTWGRGRCVGGSG